MFLFLTSVLNFLNLLSFYKFLVDGVSWHITERVIIGWRVDGISVFDFILLMDSRKFLIKSIVKIKSRFDNVDNMTSFMDRFGKRRFLFRNFYYLSTSRWFLSVISFLRSHFILIFIKSLFCLWFLRFNVYILISSVHFLSSLGSHRELVLRLQPTLWSFIGSIWIRLLCLVPYSTIFHCHLCRLNIVISAIGFHHSTCRLNSFSFWILIQLIKNRSRLSTIAKISQSNLGHFQKLFRPGCIFFLLVVILFIIWTYCLRSPLCLIKTLSPGVFKAVLNCLVSERPLLPTSISNALHNCLELSEMHHIRLLIIMRLIATNCFRIRSWTVLY